MGEVGRGTFVRSPDDKEHGWAAATPADASGVIDMSLATPWSMPGEGDLLAATLRQIAQECDMDGLLRYEAGTASLRHRAAAATWIGRTRMQVTPEQTIVTAGGQHAMTVLFSALFRPAARGKGVAMRRAALFDLAVGSLFHEAMKFRENFYQREVYGPRVRALRSAAGEETDALFQEFEKILGIVSTRLVEGLEETETLLAQTSEQRLRLLQALHQPPRTPLGAAAALGFPISDRARGAGIV